MYLWAGAPSGMSLASQLLSRITVPPGPCLSARKRRPRLPRPWPGTWEPAMGSQLDAKIAVSTANSRPNRTEARRLMGQYIDVVLLARRIWSHNPSELISTISGRRTAHGACWSRNGPRRVQGDRHANHL